MQPGVSRIPASMMTVNLRAGSGGIAGQLTYSACKLVDHLRLEWGRFTGAEVRVSQSADDGESPGDGEQENKREAEDEWRRPGGAQAEAREGHGGAGAPDPPRGGRGPAVVGVRH